MKKIKYLFLGAAVLTMASCSQDDLLNKGVDDGLYHITVKLPDEMNTRAFGSGTTANNLYMAVYDADNDNALIYEDLTQTFGGKLTTEVGLTLVKGKSYNIAFFALSPDAASQNVYTFNSTDANFKVNYEKMQDGSNNADAYDCFFKLYSIENFSGATTQATVVLQRPVAQVNWGTADLDAKKYPAIVKNFGLNGEYIVTGLTTQAYNTYGFFGGKEGSGDVVTDIDNAMSTVTLADFTAPQNEQFPVVSDRYQYVAIEYLLAPQTETLYNLTLSISNAGNEADVETITNVIDVDNAPVQANYRTNIFGSLLSENVMLTVTKDKNFKGEYNDVNTAQALADAIARGGYVQLNEDFTMSDNITVTNKVTLNLNGHSITYTGEEEGMFYIANGGDMTITGDGNITCEKYYTPIFVEGGQVTIEGGNYWVPDMTGQIVYVHTGTAYIKGGSYSMENMKLNAYPYYTLNCLDEEYRAGNANIYVSGGLFQLFNPASCPSEGSPYVSFLEEGYVSQAVTINGETWYAVVPAGTTAITQETLGSFKNGGNFEAFTDINYPNGLTISKSSVFDFMGHSLQSPGYAPSNNDNFIVLNGANVTLKNANISAATNATVAPGSASVTVVNSTESHLTLENCNVTGIYPVVMGSKNAASTITIKSGTYASDYDNGPAVYCYSSTAVLGKVIIEGGTFGKPGVNNAYLLNLYDTLVKDKPEVDPRNFIVVYGGTFINFNPAQAYSEPAPHNPCSFVADGYKVISSTVGNDTYYTVVPQ